MHIQIKLERELEFMGSNIWICNGKMATSF